MTRQMMSNGTYETVTPYEIYVFDCPNCSSQNPASGDLVECADCGSCFKVAP